MAPRLTWKQKVKLLKQAFMGDQISYEEKTEIVEFANDLVDNIMQDYIYSKLDHSDFKITQVTLFINSDEKPKSFELRYTYKNWRVNKEFSESFTL
jgi:hypothetical protein